MRQSFSADEVRAIDHLNLAYRAAAEKYAEARQPRWLFFDRDARGILLNQAGCASRLTAYEFGDMKHPRGYLPLPIKHSHLCPA